MNISAQTCFMFLKNSNKNFNVKNSMFYFKKKMNKWTKKPTLIDIHCVRNLRQQLSGI